MLMTFSAHPLVSICIPTYNAESFIQETLQSALAQTYPQTEILVQDNASTDNTWALLQALAEKHPRIVLERNSENLGPTVNFNRVVARAQGDYINILSADDLLHSAFIEQCLSIFRQQPVEAVTTNYRFLRAGHFRANPIQLAEGVPLDLPSVILLQNPFMQPFTLFSRTTIDRFTSKGRLFQTDYMPIDFDLWLRLSIQGARVYYSTEVLGTYRKHAGNMSGQLCRLNPQVVLVVLKLRRELKQACPLAYRLTLVRFIIRQFVYYGVYGCRPFNRRALYSAWYELFR